MGKELVPEHANTGEGHGHAGGVRRSDHLRVADRPAWLDHRRGACLCCLDQAVDMDLTEFDGRNWEANAASLAHLSREAAP